MRNVISIDLEQWFHRPIFRDYVSVAEKSTKQHITEATKVILQMLKKYNKQTTFFVVAEIAGQAPEIIEEISKEGHEIAFHGYRHLELHRLDKENFDKEVKAGVQVLRRVVKEKPRGFRAPVFSLSKKTVWALKILEKYGFKYDSSVLPTKVLGYGMLNAPTSLYSPSFEDPGKEDVDQTKILEFPLLTRDFLFWKVPAAGGVFLRFLGANFILKSIRNMNKRGYPAMCYVHPWELYTFPKIDLPIYKSLYAYYRVPCFRAFESLIRAVNVAPALEILEKYGYVK